MYLSVPRPSSGVGMDFEGRERISPSSARLAPDSGPCALISRRRQEGAALTFDGPLGDQNGGKKVRDPTPFERPPRPRCPGSSRRLFLVRVIFPFIPCGFRTTHLFDIHVLASNPLVREDFNKF